MSRTHHIKANQIAAVTLNIIVSEEYSGREKDWRDMQWGWIGDVRLCIVQRNTGNAFNGFSNPKTRFVMFKKMEFMENSTGTHTTKARVGVTDAVGIFSISLSFTLFLSVGPFLLCSQKYSFHSNYGNDENHGGKRRG